VNIAVDISFNIDRFMEGSGRVSLDDLPWQDVSKYRLTPEAIRTIRYFMITESATFYYLKALMDTKAAVEEPDFAPFLCAWNYEEEFHGRAFKRFLEAYGDEICTAYRGNMFNGRTVGERIDEIGAKAMSVMFPDDWPATHMVWGAIQELTTYTAYRKLIARTEHPVLKIMCERIMKQELKHFAFYYQQAKKRLERSKRAQQIARFAIQLAWTPVGDGMSEKSESVHVLRYLFDGYEGDALAGVEKRIRLLPGMDWFAGLTKYCREHNITKAPQPWFDHPHLGNGSRPSISLN